MAGNGDPKEDLQALDTALGALEADGLDADADDLDDAIDVIDGLLDTADGMEEVVAEDEKTLRTMRGDLQAIADGDTDDVDIEQLRADFEALAEQFTIVVLQAFVQSVAR